MKKLFILTLSIFAIFFISSSNATAFSFAFFDLPSQESNLSSQEDNFAYDVQNVDDTKVFLGGQAVGMSVNAKGVVLIGAMEIFTKNGYVSTIENSAIQVGDTILSICDMDVDSVSDISKIINMEENKNKVLKIKVERDGKEIETIIEPQLDCTTKTYKAGLLVRDESSGIGTITFVKQNGRFAGLGHPIFEANGKKIMKISSGNIYDIDINSVAYPKGKKPGQIMGVIGTEELGSIDKNTKFGIYGVATSKISDNLIEVGTKDDVKTGKAYIYSTIEGQEVQKFEIEIVKASKQAKPKDKGMVIKVTDKNLKKKTGGILQGMSGSPIVQNGKLIGAVTHVFMTNATLGYGMYIDFMMDTAK